MVPQSLPGYWLFHRKHAALDAACRALRKLQGLCPPGNIFSAGVCVPSTETASTWFECTTGLQLYECPRSSACLGGTTNITATVDAGCLEGTTGPMCTVCTLGWHRLETGECGRCSTSADVTSGRMLRMLGLSSVFFLAVCIVCLYVSSHLVPLCCCPCRMCGLSKLRPSSHATAQRRRVCGLRMRPEKIKMLVGFVQVSRVNCL